MVFYKNCVFHVGCEWLEKLDVVVCTYQSAKYLDECLKSIKQYIPVNKLIIVDHYSTDGTLDIAKKHGAEIILENVSLGHARQLGIKAVNTDIFVFFDSDVVINSKECFQKAYEKLKRDERLGAVVLDVWTINYSFRYKTKYDDWWHKAVPQHKQSRFYCFVTLIKKEAIKGIKIPTNLSFGEDLYIGSYLRKRGWEYEVIKTEECVHYCDYSENKDLWVGAGDRKLYGLRALPYILFRRILTAPIKAILPAIFEKDVNIIIWNTRHWLVYLKGFLKAEKYWNLKREV